jgi:hypothetical protein
LAADTDHFPATMGFLLVTRAPGLCEQSAIVIVIVIVIAETGSAAKL